MLTCVPDVNPVRSSVVPDGTAMLLRTMVAHEVLDLLAATASVNVHVALFARSGAAVGIGAGTAETSPAAATKRPMATDN
jgi:hypothetical protein